eukprot:6481331-Amphidinium_carterae.2
MANWRKLEHALVVFEDDPVLYHHRVVIEPRGGDAALVMTPDREVQETELVVWGHIHRSGSMEWPTPAQSDP